jgi:opacity protein-like surface antigen
MKRLLAVAVLAMATLAVAYAQDKKPINAKCPVKGEPAKDNITAEYEGKVIGFC